MSYQDKWMNGQLAFKGYRECINRYEIIKSFIIRNQKSPFSVCDIGSNWNYFGLRITEDFPQSMVVSFEYNSFDLRIKHLKENNSKRIFLFNRKLTLDDLNSLSLCCHFDVILALSVLHHMKENLSDLLKTLINLGDNVIVEFATNDSLLTKRSDYQIPTNGKVLGYGKSHKNGNILRPIIVFQKDKNSKS